MEGRWRGHCVRQRSRDDRRGGPRGIRARAGHDTRPRRISQWHEELRLTVSRSTHQRRLRRQGDRHQSHTADQEGCALYRRAVGRQIHENLHLSKSTDRRSPRHDRRILLAAVRAGRLSRSRRAGQYPCTPLRGAKRAIRPGGGMTIELTKTPSFRLDGKRALVTGAGRGIGLAAVSALADAGAHVTLAARTSKEIEEAAEAIRMRGQKATPLTVDVRDVEAVKKAIGAQEPFDILVNNAGTNRPAPFIDVKSEDFDFVFSLNVRAAYFVAQAVARRLVEARRGGAIINMSSQMGHVGGPTRTVYCATKHAMEGFTKAMAIELAPHKIRVNTLAPTFIETPMTRPFFENQAFREDTLRRIKLGRLGQLEDLTGAIVFLASDAAALMTGTSLVVDGGWTAE